MRSAQAAHHAPLQQSGPFASRSTSAIRAEETGVLRKPSLVGLEAIPVDVALVHVRDDEPPFRARDLANARPAIRRLLAARAAVDERARVTRIVQHLQDARMLRRRPQEIAFVRSAAQPAGEEDVLLAEKAHGEKSAAGALEGVEDEADHALHARIGIEDDPAVVAGDKAHGRRHLELAALRLAQLAAAHPRFQHMKLGFGHCSLQT